MSGWLQEGEREGHKRGAAGWFVAMTLAMWAALWFVGFPSPGRDDLVFIGGGIELFTNGRLANPLIRFWHFALVERFLFQPPLYQWIVACWFDVFGLSSESIRAFQTVLFAAASGAIGWILLRMNRALAAWLISVIFASYIGTQDLRHDVLVMALLGFGV